MPRGRHRNRRALAVLGVFALLLAGVMPSTVVATPPSRFERVEINKLDPTLIPKILDPNRSERVIVELAAEPVALHQHDALLRGEKLSKADKAAIRGQLKADQAKLAPQIARLGGQVLATYQDAYNGIRVQIAAGKLPQLTAVPGVVAVHAVAIYQPDNSVGIPYIGAPSAWQDYGFTGTGVKIGIIDTGIDYYHADFGGSGNPADFAADDGLTIGTPAFPNAKVAGGWDFVGDAYSAGSSGTPHPDPDPLDCGAHGTHVAGTAAGEGVLADGSTYTGPYDASTIGSHTWTIGPGVAPTATLYAYRIFGCSGSTDVVIDAINRAVADGMDVINMSLGSPFGASDTPDAVASNNASLAGVTVVAAAGNSGANAFMTGTPASADRVISVAAIDARPGFPGATIALPSGNISALNVNGSSALPLTASVRVLFDGFGGISLGCAAADYAGSAGQIVVTLRGTCGPNARAIFGQAAGAAAVIIVGNPAPPPSGGAIPGVTLPFLGVDGSAGPALIAANGASITISASIFANPGFQNLAPFSSGGPRDLDNAAKPDVAAPGVSVVSALMGSGTGAAAFSGTSMATPHTTGVAALVVQAHPTWSPEQIKAAIMNTADASADAHGVLSYNVLTTGAGVVAPRRAVDSVGLATTGGGTSSLSFGYEPHDGAYSESKPLTLWNTGGSAITYVLTSTVIGTATPTISISPSTVTVPAHGNRAVNVNLKLSGADMTGLPSVSTIATGSVFTVQGAVIATPTVAGTGRYALRVPFLVSPRGLSNLAAGVRSAYTLAAGVASAKVPLRNGGIHSGDADVYAWGLSDANEGLATNDIRAVGVETFPSGGDAFMVFAVNTYGRWGSASDNEFQIGIDTNKDGVDDYYVLGVDAGAETGGALNGQMEAFTIQASTGSVIDAFTVWAPANGSTVELPAQASDLGLTEGSSSFNYDATAFSFVGGPADVATGVGHFDALHPAISQGDFLSLGRGATAALGVTVNKAGFAAHPALGWMVVTLDDANGAPQADLLPVGNLP